MTPEETAKQLGVPLIPKLPDFQPAPGPNPIIAVCGECGIQIMQVMGYYCTNSKCPCSPRITC